MALATKLPWPLANPKWASEINPILANPVVNGSILSGIKVISGKNVINHKLGQTLQGYLVILNSANVTFYDGQESNQTPNLTLVLYASGSATISLYVF